MVRNDSACRLMRRDLEVCCISKLGKERLSAVEEGETRKMKREGRGVEGGVPGGGEKDRETGGQHLNLLLTDKLGAIPKPLSRCEETCCAHGLHTAGSCSIPGTG